MDHDPFSSCPVYIYVAIDRLVLSRQSAFYCHVPTTLFFYAFISLHFYYIKREEKEKAGGKTRQLTGKNDTYFLIVQIKNVGYDINAQALWGTKEGTTI